MKTPLPTLLIIFSLAGFAFLPNSQAVVPAPDGGYAGGNTAEGHLALASLDTTAGLYNTAVGVYSLLSMIDGSFCTGVGAGTLLANTGDENTATGAGALLSNTTGTQNTGTGAFALFSNTGGSFNTATGAGALLSNTTGETNTANGAFALFNNTTGSVNTAIGDSALLNNTIGAFNTAVGRGALFANTSSQANTAVGYRALGNNQPGNFNTAVGSDALLNTTGGENTAIGHTALTADTTGNGNTAVGGGALSVNTTGTGNTAVGASPLGSNTTGSGNTALGTSAGGNITTASNVISIGALGANVSNSCYIGNIYSQTSASGIPVVINSFDKLGTTTSSKRFKEDIKPMGKSSEALLALQPVTFRYKKEIDPAGTPQLGLVAEDVEKVNPELVVRDKDGKPYSVRYDQVNAMLLNEFLKEHRKIEELKKNFESKLAEQQNQIKALSSTLEKVSARIELSRPATELADDH